MAAILALFPEKIHMVPILALVTGENQQAAILALVAQF